MTTTTYDKQVRSNEKTKGLDVSFSLTEGAWGFSEDYGNTYHSDSTNKFKTSSDV